MSDVEHGLDELGTERARREIARVFAECRIPGQLRGELYAFGFADLVGRVEVLTGADPELIHIHMTLSSPSLAAPVLDCWAGMGEGQAGALEDALRQWAQGAYWAYHDAFAHDKAPSYELELDGTCWHAFEAPLQARGVEQVTLDSLAAFAPTRALLSAPELPRLSPLRAHRLRWVAGVSTEVMLDDEPQPQLTERLKAFAWPTPVAPLLRHSVVLLAHDMAATRQSNNWSMDDAEGALASAEGLVDANKWLTLLSALQHGFELNPADARAPRLCLRWSQLAQGAWPHRPRGAFDAPISRGLFSAYAAMAEGSAAEAMHWLRSTLRRAPRLDATTAAHVMSLAQLYAERALPERHDAIINGMRHAEVQANSLVSTSVSSLEAPSAVAAVHEIAPKLEISFGDIPSPDPRLPSDKRAVVLWTYQAPGFFERMLGRLGSEARPAVPAPSTEVGRAIAGLAASPYSRRGWGAKAQELARGLSDRDVPELLSVMVHPLPLAGLPAWDARFASMTAAAFVLGQLAGKKLASPAGRALRGLLDGPVDWLMTAAAIALVDLALRQPDDTEASVIELLLAHLRRPIFPVWYQCYFEPACWLLLRLPLSEAETQAVVELILQD